MAASQVLHHVAVLILLMLGGCRSQLPECGVAVTNNRIVGGSDASPGSWPWQVSLNEFGVSHCGGSLITKDWVLTAAHCIDDYRGITVYLGRHSQSGSNPKEESRTIKQAVCHPRYDFLTIDNDICLLQLSAPVNFTDNIYPVCLAAADSTFHNGTSSWVTGWGANSNGELEDILQEVKVRVVGNNECKCSHAVLTENMICAGVREGGKDACQGDSGGPLVVKHINGSIWIQSGIVSSGDGCGQPSIPGVYTRVSKYQNWISNITGSTRPGFVTFSSSGVDSDSGFACPTPSSPPSTTPPTTMAPTPADTTTAVSNTPNFTTKDKSIFGSSENVAHFLFAANVASLGSLVLLLHGVGDY
ncbi:serine protease 27-like [Takifugu flavidus]|uniref:Transmembrane protease serine 11D n=1 Tax=Takifugu flavidus TaxID=433684 RepID=A0A5C6NCA9_9TELE|nr:serine protease 27-like [Takifugu flavidus]TWW63540.1 Transmembrane protease serine 11D [Takifugu flavidus]